MKNLHNYTPDRFLCAIAASCPAVFKTKDGSYWIVGTNLDPNQPALAGKVDSHESAVQLPASLVEQAVLAAVIDTIDKSSE